MTDDDRGRFAEGLIALAETRGETISDRRAEAYFFALVDLELPQVLYAMHRAMQTGIYPKLETPGRLRELVEGAQDFDGSAAWLQLTDAVRSVGYYRTPDLPKPIMETVARIYGSWRGACAQIPAMSEYGYDTHRKQFAAMFTIVQAQPQYDLPPHERKALPPEAE